MDQKRYDLGLAKRKQVLGDAYVDRALQNVDDFNRDFQRMLTEYCWGETWGDETLKPRERSILNLGMIAALGKMEEFATHVRGALNNGLTPNEIRAALTQVHDLLRRADRRRLLPRGAADHRRAREEQEVTDARPADTRREDAAAARFPGASGAARSAGLLRAHRAGGQQGHRAASAGALAIPGRARRKTSGARFCSPTSWTAAGRRYDTPVAIGALASSAHIYAVGMGRAGRGHRRCLAAGHRQSDRAGDGDRRRPARKSSSRATRCASRTAA